eukprot:NODE_5350_length_1026_cov_40.812846_g4781_i0.p1 GENE.NODE_5350_length_1026_cov_40.812846_g4781_i0~~NODE_5350_length_1026_cov_40.812846_g4781_i0.p1  ORF type:complete len:210 (-),score=30.79 NODE_5350_length_1026_cov_40.812846_g4781_i0:140-769(-)
MDSLYNHPLVHLNISNNTLGSEGAALLAYQFSCHQKSLSLMSLDISFNGIGDDGALNLLRSIQNSSSVCLTNLDLSYNGLTSQCISDILALIPMIPSLTSLNIEDDGSLDNLKSKLELNKSCAPSAPVLISTQHNSAKLSVTSSKTQTTLQYYYQGNWKSSTTLEPTESLDDIILEITELQSNSSIPFRATCLSNGRLISSPYTIVILN